jgi:hypothetical protein
MPCTCQNPMRKTQFGILALRGVNFGTPPELLHQYLSGLLKDGWKYVVKKSLSLKQKQQLDYIYLHINTRGCDRTLPRVFAFRDSATSRYNISSKEYQSLILQLLVSLGQNGILKRHTKKLPGLRWTLFLLMHVYALLTLPEHSEADLRYIEKQIEQYVTCIFQPYH